MANYQRDACCSIMSPKRSGNLKKKRVHEYNFLHSTYLDIPIQIEIRDPLTVTVSRQLMACMHTCSMA